MPRMRTTYNGRSPRIVNWLRKVRGLALCHVLKVHSPTGCGWLWHCSRKSSTPDPGRSAEWRQDVEQWERRPPPVVTAEQVVGYWGCAPDDPRWDECMSAAETIIRDAPGGDSISRTEVECVRRWVELSDDTEPR